MINLFIEDNYFVIFNVLSRPILLYQHNRTNYLSNPPSVPTHI